jgi:uncharacterized protein YdiU (UPF0061 family)
MNRVEQRERLTEIIETIENSISGLENIRDDFDEIVVEYENLYNRLEQSGYSVLEEDVDDFSGKLLKTMIEDNADINLFEDMLDTFKSDLDDYADELSDSKREKIDERYGDWDEITDKIYSLQNDEELGFDEANDMFLEIVEILKRYKK